MKLPTLKLRKAAAKRKRAMEGLSEGQQAPAVRHPVARIYPPPKHRGPLAAPEVDLTADTPPEEVRVEMAAEPPVPIVPTPAEAERRWGEGPSAAASPPPEEMTAGSPPRTEPEHTEAAEGSRVGPTPRGFSLMNDGHRAEQLISQVILPEFQEELRHLGASRFFREAFVALVRAVNSLEATREVINEGEAIIYQARRDAEEARARAKVAERALEEARNDRAAKIREAESRAEAEANRLRAALNQLREAESAVEARDLHIAELDSIVRSAEARDERAEEAERRAASLAEEREAQAQEVEAAAEARVRKAEATAEARAIAAVEEFRASERFADELVEANMDAYLQGFRDAKEKVARVLDLPRALDIELDPASEGGPSDNEPDAADP